MQAFMNGDDFISNSTLKKFVEENSIISIDGHSGDDLNIPKSSCIIQYPPVVNFKSLKHIPSSFVGNYGLVMYILPFEKGEWIYWLVQVAFDFDGNQVFIRFYSNKQWRPWQKLPFKPET